MNKTLQKAIRNANNVLKKAQVCVKIAQNHDNDISFQKSIIIAHESALSVTVKMLLSLNNSKDLNTLEGTPEHELLISTVRAINEFRATIK